jgi:hypothetical protein
MRQVLEMKAAERSNAMQFPRVRAARFYCPAALAPFSLAELNR